MVVDIGCVFINPRESVNHKTVLRLWRVWKSSSLAGGDGGEGGFEGGSEVGFGGTGGTGDARKIGKLESVVLRNVLESIL